jgi:hypothetical protein
MPRPKPPVLTSEEERLAASFLDDLMAVAERLASEAGDPPGARPMGDAEKVRHWGLQDRRVVPQDLLTILLSTGLGEGALEMEIVKERPELLDAYANQAPDQETADQLVRLAEYPFRMNLLTHLEDDPEAWTKEAERIDRLWQKQAAPPMPDAALPVDVPAVPAVPMSPPLPPTAQAAPVPAAPEGSPY